MITIRKNISSFCYRKTKLKGGKPVPADMIEAAKAHKIKGTGKTMFSYLIESGQWVDDSKVSVKKSVKKPVEKSVEKEKETY